MFDVKMVAEFQVVQDVGFGKGLLSSVRLIYEEQYGGNVIVKVIGTDGARNMLHVDDDTFEKLHNTEVDAYRFLQKFSQNEIPCPKVYEMEKMNRDVDPVEDGYIIMEFINGITHLYCYDALKPDELIEPVKVLARFHSIGLELDDSEKSLVPNDFLKTWFTKLFTEENKNLFMKGWNEKMTEWLTSSESKAMIGKLKDLLTPEKFSKLNNDFEFTGVPNVLCHGDYSFHNVLFEKLPDGSHKFRAVCDFQSMNFGNAAQDLTRLFVTALSGKDRRDSEQRLLRVYYDEFSKITNGKVPFTWDQLTQSYTRFFQLHGAILCAVTPGVFLKHLETKHEGAEKDNFRNGMMDRYVCILEDLHRNLEDS